MKFSFFRTIIFPLIISSCSRYVQDLPASSCEQNLSPNPIFSKADEIKKLLNDLVHNGVPGCAMAISSTEGSWEWASGYSKIEDKAMMKTCNLQYLQSISKLYMAVGILKLYEQHKINLDDPIANYLPLRYQQYLPEVHAVTVRMLLNHTSGLPEYNFEPSYVAYLLQHPDHYFTTDELLKPLKKKKLSFKPGSKHVYTNTNYELLALIADSITGNHARFISESIFQPLGLSNTHYRNEVGYPNYPDLVNSYWDRYSNSILENVSQLQRMNVATLIGDDGIVCTPSDGIKFLKGLFEGKLLSASTLEMMEQWVNDSKGKPIYGLGLAHVSFNGKNFLGHSGGGIGAGCELYYIPEKQLYYCLAINLGTVTGSPIHKKLSEIKDEIWEGIIR